MQTQDKLEFKKVRSQMNVNDAVKFPIKNLSEQQVSCCEVDTGQTFTSCSLLIGVKPKLTGMCRIQ